MDSLIGAAGLAAAHGYDERTRLGGVMKSLPSDYAHYDIPELEETEFALSVSPCPLIEDSNDVGDAGESCSIDSIIADAMFREFDSR